MTEQAAGFLDFALLEGRAIGAMLTVTKLRQVEKRQKTEQVSFPVQWVPVVASLTRMTSDPVCGCSMRVQEAKAPAKDAQDRIY